MEKTMQQKQTHQIVFTRDGSPYWQFWHTEQLPYKRMRISTQIPVRADSAAQAKTQKLSAIEAALKFRAGDAATRERLMPKTHVCVPQLDTFSSYLRWWAEHRLPTHSKSGQARAQQIMPRLEAAFGDLALSEITIERVQEWITERLKTVPIIEVDGQLPRKGKLPKPQTVNREVGLLKSILKDATNGGRLLDSESKRLRVSPLYGMKNLKPANVPPKKVLTLEQQARILEQLQDNPERYALVLLGIKTLARLTNLLGLERRYYDADTRMLTYAQTKNGTQHQVWVDDDLAAALEAIPKNGAHFFPSCRVGERRNWNSHVRQWFESACKRAGVPYGRERGGITWHGATRRSSASRLLANGHNIFTVQAIGNWKDIRMVREYQVPEDAVIKAALQSLAPRLSTPAVTGKNGKN
jgi:integrase